MTIYIYIYEYKYKYKYNYRYNKYKYMNIYIYIFIYTYICMPLITITCCAKHGGSTGTRQSFVTGRRAAAKLSKYFLWLTSGQRFLYEAQFCAWFLARAYHQNVSGQRWSRAFIAARHLATVPAAWSTGTANSSSSQVKRLHQTARGANSYT